MGLKKLLERAGLIPKREESGIDSAFVFHGVTVYQKPKAEPKLKAEYKGFKFHGEEAYTTSNVPKKISTPPGAVDPSVVEEKPSGDAQVEAMLLQDPGMSGRSAWNTIKSLQIPVIDTKADLSGETLSVDEQIQQLFMKSPDISGVSLVSAMKSLGLKFGDAPQKEADSVTGNKSVLRSESEQVSIGTSRFLEASSSDNGIGPTKFKVALIQEGLGNLRDAYYYTKEALEYAASNGVFEGKKCYADHPSVMEEQDRPERSVRDIIGHFENVHTENNDDGSLRLCADLIMLPAKSYEWARSLVSQAIQYGKKYPDRELVGLSINANGDAKESAIDDFLKSDLPESAKPKLLKAKEMGISEVRVVSKITEAVSTDLVTEPGCRGKILEFIENERKKSNG